ncbi:hypothetical protein INT47_001385 [Mucor saturninus]|uniref:Uncharacterized protein n=1 Tax=Mucor saturninus TaxID=64648 RepID=A0A8H7QXY7_9FUNG|nr:hypothetical protein INT47_001385 [Mucor saturninus]
MKPYAALIASLFVCHQTFAAPIDVIRTLEKLGECSAPPVYMPPIYYPPLYPPPPVYPPAPSIYNALASE